MPGPDRVDVGMSVRVVTGTRFRSDEDEPAHQRGVAKRQGLRDVAADGETENVDLGEPQSPDEAEGIIGLRFHGVWCLAA